MSGACLERGLLGFGLGDVGDDGGLVEVVQDVAALAQGKGVPVRPAGTPLEQVGHHPAHAPRRSLPYHVRRPRQILLCKAAVRQTG